MSERLEHQQQKNLFFKAELCRYIVIDKKQNEGQQYQSQEVRTSEQYNVQSCSG